MISSPSIAIRFAVAVFLSTGIVQHSVRAADPLEGTYVEARTCQIYTGPCFANGEVGSAGKNAIMVWSVESGSYAGVELSGKSVSMIIKASETLGFEGFADAKTKKTLLVIDESASNEQTEALRSFALAQTGLAATTIQAVKREAIEMDFDRGMATAGVRVGKLASLETRKARPGDCICSNESAYYPPLTKLAGFVPGVTIEGDVKARSLGTRWSIPDTRTAYLGTFEATDTTVQQIETHQLVEKN